MRLQPVTSRGSTPPQTVELSIVEANFSTSAAVWLYDNPVLVDRLQESFQITLNAYPQWAGQLSWKNQPRFHRVQVTFGSPSDPGVEWVQNEDLSTTLADIVPTIAERTKSRNWDATDLPWEKFFPKEDEMPLAFRKLDLMTFDGLPAMVVQVTRFKCGGISIGIKVVHVLADATSLLTFASDWASVHRSLIFEQSLPNLSPTFDPSLLNNAIAGDSNSAAPDTELLKVSNTLPRHRFDWFSSPGYVLPQGIDPTTIGEKRPGPPWTTWDLQAPVSHQLIFFTPEEIDRMWKSAMKTVKSTEYVSKLDVFLSFVWSLFTKARQLEDSTMVHVDYSIGLRARIDPPLPNNFLGSPMVIAAVSLPAGEVKDMAKLGSIGLKVRNTVGLFNSKTIPAFLHDIALDQSPPHRYWDGFLGNHHMLVTSWIRSGANLLDFGFGPARFTESVMPNMDNLVQIMETGPDKAVGWQLSARVRSDVMEKVLASLPAILESL